MRGCSWGPIRPLTASGSRKPPLIPLDEALSAGRFQAAADLRRLLGRAEGAGEGAVIDALFAEIDAFHQRRVRPQHARELALQRAIGSLRVGLVLLRGDLNQIAATGRGSRLGRIGRCHPGRRWRIGRLPGLGRERHRRIGAGIGRGRVTRRRCRGTWTRSSRGGDVSCRRRGPRRGRTGACRDTAIVGRIALDSERPDPARLVVRHRAIGADGDTLEAGGGLAFWFSGGNTTRGPPDLELTSTGVSSRDTNFSPPSPGSMRSGFLAALSDGAGTTLVGLLSALMIGGSPERGEPTKVR